MTPARAGARIARKINTRASIFLGEFQPRRSGYCHFQLIEIQSTYLYS
jgi:hypothetical protein